jgi:hypothetical protein
MSVVCTMAIGVSHDSSGLVADLTIANRLFCIRRLFTLADSNGYYEDEVFDSSLLRSPNKIIRPPKSRMGFLAMTRGPWNANRLLAHTLRRAVCGDIP